MKMAGLLQNRILERKSGLPLLIMCIVIVLITYANPAFGQGAGCGPTPFGCISADYCANEKCISLYTACDTAASGTCKGCEAGCSGPQKETCIAVCHSQYAEATIMCQTEAKQAQQLILASGKFISGEVLCSEIDNCMKGTMSKLTAESFGRLLECSKDISEGTYEKAIKENWDDRLLRQNLDYSNKDVLEAMGSVSKSKELQFANVEDARKWVEGNIKNYPTKATDDFNTIWNQQSSGIRNMLKNDINGYATTSRWNQFKDVAERIKNNPVLKAAGIASGAIGAVGTAAKLLGGGEEDEDDSRAAQNSVSTVANAPPSNDLTTQVVNCVGYTASECTGPECVLDIKDGATQCISTLPGSSEVKFGSIHVIDKQLSNMYTLYGSENKGVIYEKNGYVNIHKGGTTIISVGGEGAYTSDAKSNQFYLKGGIINYFGTGTEDMDTYVGDAVTVHLSSLTAFDATPDRSGNEFGKTGLSGLTGAAAYKPIDGKLALTFDHYALPNYENAIDLGKIAEGYQLIARGFADIALLNQDKFFPMLSRVVLKGDKAIVFNKDVKVTNTYVARDGVYDYIIKADEKSTKVIARNGKIIQDSGPLDYKMSRRQASLIYNKGI